MEYDKYSAIWGDLDQNVDFHIVKSLAPLIVMNSFFSRASDERSYQKTRKGRAV